MAKRKSLNRRSSKFGRTSSKSSIGSDILNPDSNYFEDEQPFWWNLSIIGSATDIPLNNELSTVLNPDSNLQSTEEEEWWKHLQTTAPNIPTTSQGLSRASIIPETCSSAVINNTSTSESESDLREIQKRKASLRKTTHRHRESNAFLNVLNESETSIHSEPARIRDFERLQNSSLSTKVTDKQKRLSKNHDISFEHSYDNVVKRKAILRKRRNSKSLNVFEEILTQENSSRGSVGEKFHNPLQENLAKSQQNQSKNVNKEDSVNISEVPDSQPPPKNKTNSEQPPAESTYMETTDESGNLELLKPKSRFLRRLRQSSSKNVFDDILENEESINKNEKSIVHTNNQSKNSSIKDLGKTLGKPDENYGSIITNDHQRRSSRSNKKSINTSGNLSYSLCPEVPINTENSDPNNGSNVQATKSVISPTQDTTRESRRSKKILLAQPQNTSLFRNVSKKTTKTDIEIHSFEQEKVSDVTQREEQEESRPLKNPDVTHSDGKKGTIDMESTEVRSKKSVAQSRKRMISKLLNTSKNSLDSSSDNLFAGKTSNEKTNPENKNEIINTSKTSDSKGQNSREISDNIQLQVSDSEGSEIIRPVQVNQSLAQRTLESELSISTLKNLNAAAASTPILRNRRKSRLPPRRSNKLDTFVETPEKPQTMSKINDVALESVREDHNSMQVTEISKRMEKRRISPRLSNNSPKKLKTVNDQSLNREQTIEDKLSRNTRSLRKSSMRAAITNDSDNERLSIKSVHWEEGDISRSTHTMNNSRRSRKILSRIVSEEEEEEEEEEKSQSYENLRNQEATMSRRKSGLQKETIDEKDGVSDNSPSPRYVRHSTRNLSRISNENRKRDVQDSTRTTSNRTSKTVVDSHNNDSVDNEEENAVSLKAVESNLSRSRGQSSPRNMLFLSTANENNRIDEIPERGQTLSRVSEDPKTRSRYIHMDTVANITAASTTKAQRTIADFFQARTLTKSVQDLAKGLPSSQAFADKQKVAEAQKKLEEIKKRALSKVEANLNREKKVPVLKLMKRSPKKKTPTEVDKAFVVNGEVYKRPKLPRPKHWVTDRMYKYLWKCMESKYGLATRGRSEKFVLGLCEVVSIVCRRKKFENYKDELEALMQEMARLGIIRTRKDFYDFSYDFLPYEFREKAVPMLKPGNVRNIPYDPHLVFQPIISD